MSVKRYAQPVLQRADPLDEFKMEEVRLIPHPKGKYVLASDYERLEAALRAIETGDTMAGRSDWTLADVIQEHYKIARNAMAAEQS